LAHNLETVQAPGLLHLGDVLKARVSAETVIDPAIVQAVIDGASAALGLSARDLGKAANAHFGGFVRFLNLAVSIGDLNGVINNAGAFASDGDAMTDSAIEAEIAERLAGGRSLGKQGIAYLLKGDFRRLLRLQINAQASKRSYRFKESLGMLTGAKMISTLISKDIEEVTGIHVRTKIGLGASIAFDRVFLFPAIADILAAAHLVPSDDARRDMRSY